VSLQSLHTARTAILARQAEIQMISNNVANVNTPGYAERRALLTTIPGAQNNMYPGLGRGVEMAGVQRLADRLLDAQIDVETGQLGREQVLSDTLARVENVVATSSGKGFSNALNELFDSFSDLAADPSADTPRQAVIAAGEALCDQVRQVREQLQNQFARNDAEVGQLVSEVNSLAEKVAALNRSVGASGGAESAPDIIDERTVVLTELARLAGAVSAVREDGTVDVFIGGHPLVQGDLAQKLTAIPDGGTPPMTTVQFKGLTPPDGLGGELQGALDARDLVLKPALAAMDTFVKDLSDSINALHSTGFALDGVTSGLNLFTYTAGDEAGTFAMNATIVADPSLIAAADAGGQPANGGIALAMEALRTNPAPLHTYSIVTEHSDYIANLGVRVAAAQATADARQTVVDTLEGQRQELAGVSLDEEAVYLSEAQRAYNAASRIVTIALEMIDTIMALGD